MRIEFDPEKSLRNERERGLPFEMVIRLEWEKAIIATDSRKEYGEDRKVAMVPMDGRLYVVCYTRRGVAHRIVSFRKANKREEKIYEEAAAD